MSKLGHEPTVPTDAAIWAAIILLIIIVVVLIFFCCVPVYKTMQKRWNHWDDPQNDPRWEGETFQFSPTSPRMDRLELPGGAPGMPKYNRLSNSSSFSRSSSFRSGVGRSSENRSSFRGDGSSRILDRQPDAACQMPRYADQVQIKLPPKYADIFNFTGEDESLGTPPLYYSHSPSEEDIEEGVEIDEAEDNNKTTQKQKPTMTAAAAAEPAATKNKNNSAEQQKNIEKDIKIKPVINENIHKKPNMNIKMEKEKDSSVKIKNEKEQNTTPVKEKTTAKTYSKLTGANKKESAPSKSYSKLKSEIENETKPTQPQGSNPPKSAAQKNKGDIKVAAPTRKANLNKIDNTKNENNTQEKEVPSESVPSKPTKSYKKIKKPLS